MRAEARSRGSRRRERQDEDRGRHSAARTTDLGASIRFYTEKLGFALDFRYQDFHSKLVDERDPSIELARRGEHVHSYLETDGVASAADELKRKGVRWVKDVHDQGHSLYLFESR